MRLRARNPLCLLGIFLLWPLTPAGAGDRPDFSGVWELNEELSETPRDQMREAGGGRPDGGGFGGPRAGGRPGGGPGTGGRGGGPPRGGSDREAARDRMRQMEEAAALLTIAHEEPRLQIRHGDRGERLLLTDGRKDQADLDRGIIEIKTSWKGGGKLRVRSETAWGRVIKETWELAEEGRRLLVTTRIAGDGPMPTLEFTRVYDRQTAAGTANAEPDPLPTE